jgi:hypothetical protein
VTEPTFGFVGGGYTFFFFWFCIERSSVSTLTVDLAASHHIPHSLGGGTVFCLLLAKGYTRFSSAASQRRRVGHQGLLIGGIGHLLFMQIVEVMDSIIQLNWPTG